MAYQYDIFLSYRRNPETLRWIHQHLQPLLTLRVSLELGRDPVIFIDDQIEAGTDWPLELATKLATSRVLIPLWSKTYFNSKWCMEELSIMLAREEETSRRKPDNPRGLVIPGIIHDGDEFPAEISRIQYFELRECFNVRMAKDSPRAEELDEILNQQAPAIAKAIEAAPQWQPQWPKTAAAEFYRVYYNEQKPTQTAVPGLA
ncbi:MAG: toll/interleukin-1 receptor domain-containing protein [candidate division Zixibacteria bacterium]|nr:toll/interleukin-1 receptor domain-containing protein [candidate division Zixibacteria bacterium]MDH3937067.1 toll/interleukin-1 receptor domain-containing protein [candidate division Zixibacteria bacterium]MDH4034014.1 toll/interleukin-1 receptor domain-containing protein [candidate division Zixibacteria bacterium]